MAFIPSNNILDKDTHNMLVKSFVNGGIGYTEDDGTVHKISGDYVESGSSLPEVSADDNGDVLTVVSGEWAKATPSGGGSGFDAVIAWSGDGSNPNPVLVSGDYATVKAKILGSNPVFVADVVLDNPEYEGAKSSKFTGFEEVLAMEGVDYIVLNDFALLWFPDNTIGDMPAS